MFRKSIIYLIILLAICFSLYAGEDEEFASNIIVQGSNTTDDVETSLTNTALNYHWVIESENKTISLERIEHDLILSHSDYTTAKIKFDITDGITVKSNTGIETFYGASMLTFTDNTDSYYIAADYTNRYIEIDDELSKSNLSQDV
jgi:hypothetical protein